MTLDELLARAEAPAELVSWVRARGPELEQVWDALERGDHRVWVAACAGAPIEALVEGAAAAVLHAVGGLGPDAEPLALTVEDAVAGADSQDLLRAAERCEALAEGGLDSYRRPISPGHRAGARAAALVARAAEALAAGEAHLEAVRLDQARATSAYLGVGIQTALPAPAGAPRLDVLGEPSPASDAFAFCVAACAEAVREAARATEDGADAPRAARATATGTIDAVVREAVEGGADDAH